MELHISLVAGIEPDLNARGPRHKVGIMDKAGTQAHSNFNPGGCKRQVLTQMCNCVPLLCVCVRQREQVRESTCTIS